MAVDNEDDLERFRVEHRVFEPADAFERFRAGFGNRQMGFLRRAPIERADQEAIEVRREQRRRRRMAHLRMIVGQRIVHRERLDAEREDDLDDDNDDDILAGLEDEFERMAVREAHRREFDPLNMDNDESDDDE